MMHEQSVYKSYQTKLLTSELPLLTDASIVDVEKLPVSVEIVRERTTHSCLGNLLTKRSLLAVLTVLFVGILLVVVGVVATSTHGTGSSFLARPFSIINLFDNNHTVIVFTDANSSDYYIWQNDSSEGSVKILRNSFHPNMTAEATDYDYSELDRDYENYDDENQTVTDTSLFDNKLNKEYELNADCLLDFDEESNEKSITKLLVARGKRARPNQWPYLVYIVLKYKEPSTKRRDGTFSYHKIFETSCGATLIDRQTLLTAAHCFPQEFEYFDEKNSRWYQYRTSINSIVSSYSVYLGIHSLKDIERVEANSTLKSIHKRSIKSVKLHEHFESTNFLNDIAIVKLDKRVELSSKIQVACLPLEQTNNYPVVNSTVWVPGWGHQQEENHLSTPVDLNYAKLTVYNSTHCTESGYGMDEHRVDWDSQICAGDLVRSQSPCDGDSGGGLYTKEMINGKHRPFVAGVVSYGDNCDGITPNVYTRTSYYLKWIRRHL